MLAALRLGSSKIAGLRLGKIRKVTNLPQARAMACSAQGPAHHVLQTKYVPDILERRTPFREEHLQKAKAAEAAGKLVMVGTLGDPPEGAVWVFKASKDEVTEFVKEDPYINNGLVTDWAIKPYNVVIGAK